MGWCGPSVPLSSFPARAQLLGAKFILSRLAMFKEMRIKKKKLIGYTSPTFLCITKIFFQIVAHFSRNRSPRFLGPLWYPEAHIFTFGSVFSLPQKTYGTLLEKKTQADPKFRLESMARTPSRHLLFDFPLSNKPPQPSKGHAACPGQWP